MLSIKENIKVKDTLTTERKPVLVYNSRVDSILNNITEDAEKNTITTVTADWLLFMDDINSKMFDKISF
ncbi:hypothetical protein [Ulvibacter litoralis]|uniref:Uncharacterized protein n=1 Tax=Ulvibacter litoralis TaxID=227084 RepID=A0A1G7FR08_9FLAO|nr:hypothetical protein [Ulvibacter litoralis]GHC50087.1 hypothetical protein GCM10008083_11940 [Ulvibacter litoralis]SDE78357.1 hypothetical protein SAMN05421855_102719 [Ulvibacter litoralis]